MIDRTLLQDLSQSCCWGPPRYRDNYEPPQSHTHTHTFLGTAVSAHALCPHHGSVFPPVPHTSASVGGWYVTRLTREKSGLDHYTKMSPCSAVEATTVHTESAERSALSSQAASRPHDARKSVPTFPNQQWQGTTNSVSKVTCGVPCSSLRAVSHRGAVTIGLCPSLSHAA